ASEHGQRPALSRLKRLTIFANCCRCQFSEDLMIVIIIPTWFFVVVTLIFLHVPPALVFGGGALILLVMVLRWIGRFIRANGPQLYAAWGRAVRIAFPLPLHRHPIGTLQQQQEAERQTRIVLIVGPLVLAALIALACALV